MGCMSSKQAALESHPGELPILIIVSLNGESVEQSIYLSDHTLLLKQELAPRLKVPLKVASLGLSVPPLNQPVVPDGH